MHTWIFIQARESEKKLREVSSIALTPEHIESLTRFVEQSYCENAAAVNEPVGLRSSVASEFKDFIGVELPGSYVFTHETLTYVCRQVYTYIYSFHATTVPCLLNDVRIKLMCK